MEGEMVNSQSSSPEPGAPSSGSLFIVLLCVVGVR
jgi:hypothetical protein